MAGIKGAPAPKPSQLAGPIANENQADDVDSLLAQFEAPEAPAAEVAMAQGTPAPVAGDADVDSLLSQFSAPEEEAKPLTEDDFNPEPGFLEANINQFANIGDRLRAGLAANDNEKIGFLQQKYGDKNVAVRDGKIYFRKDPKAKFDRFDPATFELAADLAADWSREGVMEGAMLPFELGGAFAGSFTGPAAPLAIPAMGVAGRVSAVPYANATADSVAQAAGVPRDPNRDIDGENLWGMAAEATMPIGMKYAAKMTKFIPGTSAYKAAKASGAKEVVALADESVQLLKAADELEKDGIKVGLTLNQINPNDPKLATLAGEAGSDPKFINKQMEFAQGYKEALTKTWDEVKRLVDSGGKKDGKLGATLTDSVTALEKAEGEAIGNYRKQAAAKLKNQKIQYPPELRQQVEGLIREFGFKPRQQVDEVLQRRLVPDLADGTVPLYKNIKNQSTKWRPPVDLKSQVGKKGLTSVGEVRAVTNNLNELAKGLENGVPLHELERLVTMAGELNPSLSGAMKGEWGKLTGALRQHRRGVIGETLEKGEREIFEKHMDDFSVLRTNVENLKGVLRGDVSNKTVVSSFFNGKENLSNIQAIKRIVGEKSPEWGALREEFLTQLMEKHQKSGFTGVNSEGLLKELKTKYGTDFMNEVIPPKEMAKIQNLLLVGRGIEANLVKIGKDQGNKQLEQGVSNGVFGMIAGATFKKVQGVMQIIGAVGKKENPLMELFNRNGYEQYLAKYRGQGDRGKIAKGIEEMLSSYNAVRAGENFKGTMTRGIEEVVSRAAKSTVREKVMRD